MLLESFKNDKKGNISILALVLVIFTAFLFLLVFDLCQIFVARENTKNASDAASLAAAQNLVFFEGKDLKEIVQKVAEKNNCVLVDCIYGYDEVVVIVEKEVNFILIGSFTSKYNKVESASKAKVIYPWDKRFGFCKYYKFDYKSLRVEY